MPTASLIVSDMLFVIICISSNSSMDLFRSSTFVDIGLKSSSFMSSLLFLRSVNNGFFLLSWKSDTTSLNAFMKVNETSRLIDNWCGIRPPYFNSSISNLKITLSKSPINSR